MLYKNYKGPRLTYNDLSLELQAVALNDFYRINLASILDLNKDSNLHSRINNKYYYKGKKDSIRLINRILIDSDYRLKIFDANLVQFTSDGQYLNSYLEK